MLSLTLCLAVFAISEFVLLETLRVGALWLKSPRAGWWSAVKALLAMDALNIAIAVMASLFSASSPDVETGKNLVAFFCYLVAFLFIVRRIFAYNWRTTWAHVGIVTAAQVVLAAILLLVYRPFIAEAFLVPTNSMAPAIVGWHKNIACPKCGGTAFLPAYNDQRGRPAPFRTGYGGAICSVCRSLVPLADDSGEAATEKGPDHIMVNKLEKPRRWDIVAYRSARDGQIYIKRLVGLPGETIFIDDGAAWLNGKRLDVPPTMKGQTYVSTTPRGMPIQYGTREHPVQLLADECFLLGDFSVLSQDSRYSGPDKFSAIIGVVDFRYWPLNRLGFLR